MTLYQIRKAMEDLLALKWGEVQPPLPQLRKLGETAPSLPYAEAWFRPGKLEAIELDGASQRSGTLLVNIFTAQDGGEDQGWIGCGAIEQIFRNNVLEGIVCRSGTLLPHSKYIGIDEARQALHFQTTIPFSVITED